MNQQIREWSERTRSDVTPLLAMLDNPEQLFAAKALVKEILDNFDELDKLLDTTGPTNE